jgi:hypothetical protein
MSDAGDDILAFAAANAGSFLGHIFFTFRRARNARRSGCDQSGPRLWRARKIDPTMFDRPAADLV